MNLLEVQLAVVYGTVTNDQREPFAVYASRYVSALLATAT